MTASDAMEFIIRRGLGQQFANAAQILGVSFQEARERTAYFRVDDFINIAYRGTKIAQQYFLRKLFRGQKVETNFRHPISCQVGDWQGFGLFNLLPWSLKRDSGFDFGPWGGKNLQ
jgi:hypothetical protein